MSMLAAVILCSMMRSAFLAHFWFFWPTSSSGSMEASVRGWPSKPSRRKPSPALFVWPSRMDCFKAAARDLERPKESTYVSLYSIWMMKVRATACESAVSCCLPVIEVSLREFKA